ncbi:MAG: hypothetical protein VXU42_06875, partial [Verrucomicrobiota bacterium]|nr:hypothetical protein [Verrucomicrobiota bacterium]
MNKCHTHRQIQVVFTLLHRGSLPHTGQRANAATPQSTASRDMGDINIDPFAQFGAVRRSQATPSGQVPPSHVPMAQMAAAQTPANAPPMQQAPAHGAMGGLTVPPPACGGFGAAPPMASAAPFGAGPVGGGFPAAPIIAPPAP